MLVFNADIQTNGQSHLTFVIISDGWAEHMFVVKLHSENGKGAINCYTWTTGIAWENEAIVTLI